MLTQWRAGPNGIIGLDYGAVSLLAGTLELPFDQVVYRKLHALEMVVLKGVWEKQEKESRAPSDPKSAYCRACRAVKKNRDCSTCNTETIRAFAGKGGK